MFLYFISQMNLLSFMIVCFLQPTYVENLILICYAVIFLLPILTEGSTLILLNKGN